jgi:hypothetical protein
MIQRNGPAKQDHFFGLNYVHSAFLVNNFNLMIKHFVLEYGKRVYCIVALIAVLGICFSCNPEKTGEDPVFTKLSSRETNIT